MMSENKSDRFIILPVLAIVLIIGFMAGEFWGDFTRRDDLIRIEIGVSIVDLKYEGFEGLQLRFTARNGTKILVPITGSMKVSIGPGWSVEGFEIKEIYSNGIGLRWYGG